MEFEITNRETIYDAATGKLRLQTWVSRAPEEYDHNIFVYQVVPGVPENDQLGRFVHIAGYADMYSFMPEEPDPELPYYRLSYYDLLFDSSEKLEDAKTLTETFIKQLLVDIAKKDSIPQVELITVNI